MTSLKMTQIVFLLITSFLISSCNSNTSNYSDLTPSDGVPSIMQPDWTGIDTTHLPVKYGQVLSFNKDSIEMTAIVLDFVTDEGLIDVGLCLINDNKLFGRQIPNGLANTTCLDLLDFSYLPLNRLKDFRVIETLKVNKNKVGIGSIYPVSNLLELKENFQDGIDQRRKEQTPCDKGLMDLNPVRECYFEIEKITKMPDSI